MAANTSECSGNRPSAFFENTSSPSTTTSKTPPPDLMYFGLTPYFFLRSAARLAAFGS